MTMQALTDLVDAKSTDMTALTAAAVGTSAEPAIASLVLDGAIDEVYTLYEIVDSIREDQLTIGTLPIPTAVSMMKARIALNAAGLLTTVDNAVTAAADTDLKLAWDFAAELHHDSPFVSQMLPALGMTQMQIDNLFRAAGQ